MLPCVALSYATLHYLAQCYIKLHFFTLHSLMSHVILLLCFTHHCTTLSCFTLHQFTLCYVSYIIICCIALQFVQSHSLALPWVTLCYTTFCWADRSKHLLVKHFLLPEMQHPWLMLILTGHPSLLLSGGVQQNCHSSCYGLNKEKTAWLSGYWTCRTQVFFLWTFIFLCFSQFPSMFSLANLFSIIPFSYLLITRDTQDEGEARFRFYWYRKRSKSNFMT